MSSELPNSNDASDEHISPEEDLDGAQKDAQEAQNLEEELAKTKDQLMRALAEAENTRKRAIKDRDEAARFGITRFARDLLDVSDNFRRALDAIPEELRENEQFKAVIVGIEATETNLLKTFENHGVKKIEPMDEPFDPNFHEVMFETPGTGKPAGTIIQLVEPGYVIADRLLRPARVGVAKADAPETPATEAPAGSTLDTEA